MEKKVMPTKDEIRTFSLLIESLASDMRCTRMEAIIDHCKKTGLEVDIAGTLLSQALKSRIQEEAQDLNLLRKTSRLPI
jgi:hypothetical protein